MLLRECNLCYNYDPPPSHSHVRAGNLEAAGGGPALMASRHRINIGSNWDISLFDAIHSFVIMSVCLTITLSLSMDVFLSLARFVLLPPLLFFIRNLAGLQVAGIAGRQGGGGLAGWWGAGRWAGRARSWGSRSIRMILIRFRFSSGGTSAVAAPRDDDDDGDVAGREKVMEDCEREGRASSARSAP